MLGTSHFYCLGGWRIYIYIFFFWGGGGCHTVFRGNGGEISHNQSIKGGGGGCRKLIPIKGGVNKNITEPYGGGTQPHLPTPAINNDWSLSQSNGKTGDLT